MRTKRTRLELGVVLAAALLMRADLAGAVTTPLTYDAADSFTTITHIPNGGQALPIAGSTDAITSSGTLQTAAANKNKPTLTFTPTTSFPGTPSYQFSSTDTVKVSSTTKGTSVAKASVEEVTNSSTAGVKVQAGTGVTQVSNTTTHAYNSASDLHISFDEFWTVGSNGAGPGVTGVASFALAGTVASGGSASFTGHFDFLDDSVFSDVASTNTVGGEGANIGSIDFPVQTFTASFTQSFSKSVLLDDPSEEDSVGFLPAGAIIEIVGFIDFKATDDSTSLILSSTGGVGATTDPSGFLGVPEPGTVILAAMGLGSAALSILRRRRALRL